MIYRLWSTFPVRKTPLIQYCDRIVWTMLSHDTFPKDCWPVGGDNGHWYGGRIDWVDKIKVSDWTDVTKFDLNGWSRQFSHPHYVGGESLVSHWPLDSGHVTMSPFVTGRDSQRVRIYACDWSIALHYRVIAGILSRFLKQTTFVLWLCNIIFCNLSFLHIGFPLADLRRRTGIAMAPIRKETAIKKAHKLLSEGAKITETTRKWRWTTVSESTKIIGPPQKKQLRSATGFLLTIC